MVLYQEKFFNKRNWILENVTKLDLKPAETLLILSIDFMNEFSEIITVDSLKNRTNMTKDEIEKTIDSLCSKGYLQISTKHMKIVFDISAIFTQNSINKEAKDVFTLFEKEFNKVLSQKELTVISEWLNVYDEENVIDALRTASINDKLNFKYIEKILANKDEN